MEGKSEGDISRLDNDAGLGEGGHTVVGWAREDDGRRDWAHPWGSSAPSPSHSPGYAHDAHHTHAPEPHTPATHPSGEGNGPGALDPLEDRLASDPQTPSPRWESLDHLPLLAPDASQSLTRAPEDEDSWVGPVVEAHGGDVASVADT
jgi:hypothetical protein